MARAATHKLFVNLSASQTRKRLAGHGFGVRRVEAAGRNQAVIVHTATGAHLRELESLFADVSSAVRQSELDTPVDNLRNIGPATAARLREVGVRTRGDLERCGPVFAYRLVARHFGGTSLNLLWALAAALRDADWRSLSATEKDALRRQLDDA